MLVCLASRFHSWSLDFLSKRKSARLTWLLRDKDDHIYSVPAHLTDTNRTGVLHPMNI